MTIMDRKIRGENQAAIEGWVLQLQAEAVCFICNGTGHQHGQCPNHPLCYNCKCSGHKAMFCPAKKGLRNCGFGIPGAGFFSIHIPTDKGKGRKKSGAILPLV